MKKSEDVIRMVAVSRDYDITDYYAEIHEYYAFPDGEQLEIHEEQGKFTYKEFNSDRKVIDSHEFDRYGEAFQILQKRKNKIMGWKPSPFKVGLNFNPVKDIVY